MKGDKMQMKGDVQRLSVGKSLPSSFIAVCIDSFLDLVNGRYIGDGAPICPAPTFTLLVLKIFKYSILFCYSLELVS